MLRLWGAINRLATSVRARQLSGKVLEQGIAALEPNKRPIGQSMPNQVSWAGEPEVPIEQAGYLA